MQPLGPLEKVALYYRSQPKVRAVDVPIRYEQVAVNPERRIRLLVHVEPSFRSEFISVWSPQVLITMKE